MVALIVVTGTAEKKKKKQQTYVSREKECVCNASAGGTTGA
jgi:hypothetical protein